jgi:hypothetical protein
LTGLLQAAEKLAALKGRGFSSAASSPLSIGLQLLGKSLSAAKIDLMILKLDRATKPKR